jgi:hypothetical protein
MLREVDMHVKCMQLEGMELVMDDNLEVEEDVPGHPMTKSRSSNKNRCELNTYLAF